MARCPCSSLSWNKGFCQGHSPPSEHSSNPLCCCSWGRRGPDAPHLGPALMLGWSKEGVSSTQPLLLLYYSPAQLLPHPLSLMYILASHCNHLTWSRAWGLEKKKKKGYNAMVSNVIRELSFYLIPKEKCEAMRECPSLRWMDGWLASVNL